MLLSLEFGDFVVADFFIFISPFYGLVAISFADLLDVVQFSGLLPYPLAENTAVTVTAQFKEGNKLHIVIPLIPSEIDIEGT
jgi:hypothetical protein